MSDKKEEVVATPQDNNMPAPPASDETVTTQDNNMPAPPAKDAIKTMDNNMPTPPALKRDGE
ncbi:hypothetical protein ACGFY8_20545 [Streptomyces sp. NPDC048232]|uniref:hypothetical protein n=1 Tax=unclassified Streptomyces TaxID=2593676 RepID=UPI003401EC9D